MSITICLGDVCWDIYQYLGIKRAPDRVLSFFSGMAEFFWGENKIIYAFHHCWNCPDYHQCELHPNRSNKEIRKEGDAKDE